MKRLLIAFLLFGAFLANAQTELIVPTGHQDYLGINGLAVSPDGALAASFVDKEVKIWDVKKKQLLKTFHEKDVIYAAAVFSPDSKTLMLSCEHEVSINNPQLLNIVGVDTRTLKEQSRRDLKIMNRARCLAYSPDGKYLYMGGDGETATIAKLNLATGETTALYKDKNNEYCYKLSLSPNGSQLMAQLGIDNRHYIIVNTAGGIVKDFAKDENEYRFSPAGNILSVDFLESRDKTGKSSMRFRFRWLEPATYKVQATQTLKYVGDLLTNAPSYAFDFFPGTDDVLFNADKYYHVVNRAGPVRAIPLPKKAEENSQLFVKVVNPALAVIIRQNYVSTLNPVTAEYHEMGMSIITPDRLYNAADGKTLAVMGQFAAKPYFITWANGKLIIKQVPTAFSLIGASVNTSPDGKVVSWAEAAAVKVADVANLSKPVSVFPVKNGEYTVISPDKNLVAIAAGHESSFSTDKIYIANRKTGLVKLLGNGYFTQGVFSSDGHYFLGIYNRLNDDPVTTLYDAQKGIKLWQITGQDQHRLMSPFFYSATEVGYYDDSYDEFNYLSFNNGAPSRTEKIGTNALSGNAYLQRTLLPGVLNKPDVQAGFNNNAVVDSGLFTIASFKDNTLKVYNRAGVKLMDIILTETGGDWAIVTPDGRFDASEKMMKQLYYANGRQVISLEKLFENYYTPNLGGRLLAGEILPPVPPIGNINAPPRVKISYAEVTRNLNVVDDKVPVYQNATGVASITVNAAADNDKIDEIRLFQNGKIVNLATRGLFVTDNTTGTDTKTYTINLLPGQNNFRALALNSQRTESEPNDIIVNYRTGAAQPNAPASNATDVKSVIAPVDKDATIHLIVVGINQYQNPKMSLNYALVDATAFKNEAEKDARTMAVNVKTYFITDDKADKTGILNALKAVQQIAKPQDVLVFYYAGHGVISNKNKEFYLVPTNVTDLKNVDEALAQNGIPSKMLQQYAIDIAAQKQVFILDACQSAGAFATLLSNDGDQQKSLATVARSTGTHWIAASGSQQFANEFSQLGHGAFTYVLLKAMQGDAVNNKMITVNGLKNYLQVQVPDLMKKYNGTPQYPASYGFGSDFPVEVIK